MKGLADSVYESIVLAVAEDRKLDPGAVRNLFDRCPMTAQEAVRAGLADGIASQDDVRARLRELARADVHPLSVEEYLPACRSAPSSGKWIAVVHVLGLIADGESREMSFAGRTAGADDIVRALRESAEDPDVVGILLRIDSGGGSASASEKIFAAVESARKRKPLVASLADTAASGGYYAAAAADKVIAQRTSITGSIGVFGGKLVVERLLGTLKVGRRSWDRGKRAGMYDSTRPFTPDERMAVKDIMEDVYRRFVDRIAASRRKSFEDVNAVAQGRVWTGRAAVDAGLVDSVGGIPEALEALRSLARVPEGTSIGVRRHPEPRGILDDLLGSGGKRDPFLHTLVRNRPVGPEDLRDLLESRLFSGRSGFALLPIRIQVR
jgi:protease-4